MIHDELTRLFARTPPPALSPEFAMNLRRRLRHTGPRELRHDALRRWTARLYWAAAAALLAWLWTPVMLSTLQAAVVATMGAAIVVTLRRAARPGPLTRVLRQLWR